jgi:hypothetical protein
MAQRGRPRKNREPLERIMARATRIGRPAPEGSIDRILKVVERRLYGDAYYRRQLQQMLEVLAGILYRRDVVAHRANKWLQRFRKRSSIEDSEEWAVRELLNVDAKAVLREVEQEIKSARDWDTDFIAGSFLPQQYVTIFDPGPTADARYRKKQARTRSKEMVAFILAVLKEFGIHIKEDAVMKTLRHYPRSGQVEKK